MHRFATFYTFLIHGYRSRGGYPTQIAMTRRDQIRRLMEEAGSPPLRQLAKLLGTDHSLLSKYLEGPTQPRKNPLLWDEWEAELRKIIAKKNDLAGTISASRPQLLQLTPSFPMVKIPIVATASAGRGDSEALDDSLEVPVIFSNPNYRGLIARGDSQVDEIFGDDIVIVDQTSERKPGVISCILCGPELLLKKLEWSRSDSRWEMLSKNSAHPPAALPFDAVVQGFVVGVYRPDASGVGFEMKFDPTGRRFGAW